MIIHTSQERKTEALPLGMDVAFAKKYNRNKDEFSVSLSGANCANGLCSKFRLELHDLLTTSMLAVKDSDVRLTAISR